MSEAVWPEALPGEPDFSGSPEKEEAAVERAKAYLSRVSALDRRIERKLLLRDRLLALATRVTGDFSAPPVPGAEDGRAAAVTRLVDLDREINRDIDHLVNLKNEIWGVLEQIDNPEAALILDDCYLGGLSVPRSAERSGFSVRYTYKLRRYAFLEVDRILRSSSPMCGYVSPLDPSSR